MNLLCLWLLFLFLCFTINKRSFEAFGCLDPVSLPVLEGELKELNDDISDVATLCAVGDDRIHYIKEFFLAHISIVNAQQDSKAEQYNDQVSEVSEVYCV